MTQEKLPHSTRILFLDIDGVLNSELFFEKTKGKHIYPDTPDKHFNHQSSQVDRDALKLVSDMCKENNIKVVLSSTWRLGFNSTEEINTFFTALGAEMEFIGATPSSREGVRGVEIKMWIDKCIETDWDKPYRNYVILDDDSDMLLNQAQNFFHVDRWYGVTHNTVYKMTRFFNSFNP
jgi:histidinol phosphatase-like enzyme